MFRGSSCISAKWLAFLVVVAFSGLFKAMPAHAQGPRAGVTFVEPTPLLDANERMRGEGERAAKLSRGLRGTLIGMAIGTAVGVGLGYLACSHEGAEIPCSYLIPVFGAGGLGLGALMGYSIGREAP